MPLSPEIRRVRYGASHRALRARLTATVAAGEASCARCGAPIRPDEAWDLGHAPGEMVVYRGPEHRRCNRATARPRWQPAVRSRAW